VIAGSFERSDSRLPIRAKADTPRARRFRTIARVDRNRAVSQAAIEDGIAA